MNSLKKKLQSILLKSLGKLSAIATPQLRKLLGKGIGTVLRWMSSKRFQITVSNLQEAYPEKSSHWIRTTAYSSYHNLGIVLAEILAFQYLSNQQLIDIIQFTNIELLGELYGRSNGMILLSGHFGNWELLAYSAGLLSGIPINIVVAPQHNPIANEYINEFRSRHNNRIVPMTNAARNIVHILQNNGVVAMLADQAANSSKNIFVDFFHRPASTYDAPAALALKFKFPLIIGFAVRQASGAYLVTLQEIKYDDLEYSKEGIAELTRRHVAILEREIRNHPDQWSWQHKRWKI
jgi:KDO2-lipid IV(A) lauroyltransferase